MNIIYAYPESMVRRFPEGVGTLSASQRQELIQREALQNKVEDDLVENN